MLNRFSFNKFAVIFFLTIAILVGTGCPGAKSSVPVAPPPVGSFAKPTDKINPKRFDAVLLERLVERKVNELRKRKRRTQLGTDKILRQAAYDQCNYVLNKGGDLTHNQRNKEKKTVRDRVLYYGGKHYLVGENLQYQGFLIRHVGNTHTVLYNTYNDMAKKMVEGWIGSPGHYENLIYKDFRLMGTSAIIDNKKHGIYLAQVYGALR